MLRLPKISKEDAAVVRQIESELQSAISRAESTDDSDEQEALLNEIADLERRLNVARSRHLLAAVQAQGLEMKPDWLLASSGLQWLTSEGHQSIRHALERRRREDWIKLFPMLVSIIAILVSIASAVVTTEFSQQKDFLLNRSWLSVDSLSAYPDQDDHTSPDRFLLNLSNHGRAPALHATLSERTLATSVDETTLDSLTRNICHQVATPSEFGSFVAPGTSSEFTFEPLQDPTLAEPVMILGCVGYEDSLDHKRHVTSFGFRRPSVKLAGKSEQTTSWVPYSLGYGIAW